MMRSNSCPKCQSSMSEGYVIDHNSSAAHGISQWVAGAPVKGLFGLKTRGKAIHDIQTWRCGRCGLLESYAKG